MTSRVRFPRSIRKAIATIAISICALAAVGIIGYPGICANSIEKFNPNTYKGKIGKISLKYRGESTLFVRNQKSSKEMQLSTKNGIVIAPVGSYRITSYMAKGADKNKVSWIASASFKKPMTIEVTENRTKQVDLGPPLVASIRVRVDGDRANMSFKLTNEQGNHDYMISKTTGKTDPPGFKVIDESGKTVWSGSFAYG